MGKIITIAIATLAMAIPGVSFAKTSLNWDAQPALTAEKPTTLLAQRRRGKKKRKGAQERHIVREKRVKGKDVSNVDFESVDIGGKRRTPMGTLINQNKADKNYDFVKIRLRWHPEMIQSASSLDAGQ